MPEVNPKISVDVVSRTNPQRVLMNPPVIIPMTRNTKEMPIAPREVEKKIMPAHVMEYRITMTTTVFLLFKEKESINQPTNGEPMMTPMGISIFNLLAGIRSILRAVIKNGVAHSP